MPRGRLSPVRLAPLRQTDTVRPSLTDLVIVGGAGHGRELLDIVDACNAAQATWRVLGVVDDDPARRDLVEARGSRFLGDLDELAEADARYLLGIGSERVRAELDDRLTGLGLTAATVLHPAATVGSANDLNPGIVLFPGARVTTNVTLGRHTHLNVNASVSHDCVVGDHTTISPGAVVAGSCRIGDRVLVGAGATILQGRTVGDDAVVGAGAVVVDDVPSGVTVVGVPARQIGGPGRPRS